MLILLSAYLYKFHLKPRQAKFIFFLNKYFPWLKLQPAAVNALSAVEPLI
jgi:hypothetical protein